MKQGFCIFDLDFVLLLLTIFVVEIKIFGIFNFSRRQITFSNVRVKYYRPCKCNHTVINYYHY